MNIPKLAIIGSRDFKDKELFDKVIFAELIYNPETEVLTGGARGVDRWVEEFCEKEHMVCTVIKPRNPSNKMDYLYRNIEIITLADEIIAFWDKKSRGTKFIIDYAKARNKKIRIINDKN